MTSDQAISGIDRVDLIDHLKLIEDYVYDLANFVGLLKFAFFQRTVSSEIPHVASGMPHSPERTIGNELFYLAADNVAKRYYECLNIPYGKWDGFITFTPPIEEYFYGAFYRPSPYLKLFHISMSEEAKYFVGTYLALAHEFAHGVMRIGYKIGPESYVDYPKWFKIITGKVWSRTIEFLDKRKQDLCLSCPIYEYLGAHNEIDRYKELCEELLADIIAYHIAGKNYIYEFIDCFYQRIRTINLLFSLRAISTVLYLREYYPKDYGDLMNRVSKIIEDTENTLEKYGFECPYSSSFSGCIVNICQIWADTIIDFNENTCAYLIEELENRVNRTIKECDEYLSYIEEIKFKDTIDTLRILEDEPVKTLTEKEDHFKRIIDSNWEQLFPAIVRYEFKIDDSKEDTIIGSLVDGTPVPEEDPRHILHCYYEAYKRSEGEERPNYAATIYSLAFNTYNETFE